MSVWQYCKPRFQFTKIIRNISKMNEWTETLWIPNWLRGDQKTTYFKKTVIHKLFVQSKTEKNTHNHQILLLFFFSIFGHTSVIELNDNGLKMIMINLCFLLYMVIFVLLLYFFPSLLLGCFCIFQMSGRLFDFTSFHFLFLFISGYMELKFPHVLVLKLQSLIFKHIDMNIWH